MLNVTFEQLILSFHTDCVQFLDEKAASSSVAVRILATTSWSHPIVCFKEKILSPVHQSSPVIVTFFLYVDVYKYIYIFNTILDQLSMISKGNIFYYTTWDNILFVSSQYYIIWRISWINISSS